MKVSIKQLASAISKLEGKKHQASVGDVREVLSILSDMAAANPVGVTNSLVVNGIRRKKIKAKKD